MDPNKALGCGEEASPSSQQPEPVLSPPPPPPPLSRYKSQKRRDWNTFQQYLKNHKPPLSLSRCSGAHVIEFLKYLDQFGKTKVHLSAASCPFYGQPNPPSPCSCPLRQAWGSLDALIGRLRAAFEENGGKPESNPFAARPVTIYLREVRESQAKARGIPYEKKKKRKNVEISGIESTSEAEFCALDDNTNTSAIGSGVDTGINAKEKECENAPPPQTEMSGS